MFFYRYAKSFARIAATNNRCTSKLARIAVSSWPNAQGIKNISQSEVYNSRNHLKMTCKPALAAKYSMSGGSLCYKWNTVRHYGSANFSSAIVSVENVSKAFQRSVFDDISLDLHIGDRAMLFGANGIGKSTLAKILAGEIMADGGGVSFAEHIVIGYLPQDIDSFALKHNITTIRDYLLRPFDELKEITEKIEVLLKKGDAHSLLIVEQYKKEYHAKGGYKISKVLRGLRIDHLSLSRDFLSLSGGEKCRVALAGLLLSEPHLLILDEPTNHLDTEAKLWVEAYLKGYPNALLVVTHDRSFMNNVGNRMMILDAESRSLQHFKGTYLNYLAGYKRKYEADRAKLEKEQFEIDQVKNQLEKLSKKRSKADHHSSGDASRIMRLTKELKALKENQSEASASFQIPNYTFSDEPKTASGPAVTILHAQKTYANRQVLKECAAELRFGDRILLLGNNGSGKSTLLRIIAKQDAGMVEHGKGVKVAYLPQEPTELDAELSVYDAFNKRLNLPEGQVRHFLKRCCLFDNDKIFTRVGDLSVGQQRKVQIAKIIAARPNVLLLDEPTNHLDVLSAEAFEQSLLAFNGAILAVSHDARFISKIANKTWQINDGQLTTNVHMNLLKPKK